MLSSIGALVPKQLRVGTRGGCEANVHEARTYLETCTPSKAQLKLDFSNAFNTIRRDSMFESIAKLAPQILPYVLTANSDSSILQFGEFVVSSQEGVHQGDPLGPLLYSLTMTQVLDSSSCEFTAGYLDDVTLGDSVEILIEEVKALENRASAVGIKLNNAKCEIIGLSYSVGSCRT